VLLRALVGVRERNLAGEHSIGEIRQRAENGTSLGKRAAMNTKGFNF
jgi:hypothetical protein